MSNPPPLRSSPALLHNLGVLRVALLVALGACAGRGCGSESPKGEEDSQGEEDSPGESGTDSDTGRKNGEAFPLPAAVTPTASTVCSGATPILDGSGL